MLKLKRSHAKPKPKPQQHATAYKLKKQPPQSLHLQQTRQFSTTSINTPTDASTPPIPRPPSLPTGPPPKPKTAKKGHNPANNKTRTQPTPHSTTTTNTKQLKNSHDNNQKGQSNSKQTKTAPTKSKKHFEFEKDELNQLYLQPPQSLKAAQFFTLLKITPPPHFFTHLDAFSNRLNEPFGPGGITPLIAVSAKGKLDMMKELHIRGANVNIPGKDGDTPLHVAIKSGNLITIRWLLARGADVHQVNNLTSLSPLMTAAKTFHSNVIDVLVEHGCNLNQQNVHGQTALMYAAQYSSRQMIEALYKYEADITLCDDNGLTAYDYAHQHKKSEMSSIIDLCYSGRRSAKYNPLTPEILARKRENEMKHEASEIRDQIFDHNGKFHPELISQIWRAVQHTEIYQQTGLFPDSIEIVVKKHRDTTRHFTNHQMVGQNQFEQELIQHGMNLAQMDERFQSLNTSNNNNNNNGVDPNMIFGVDFTNFGTQNDPFTSSSHHNNSLISQYNNTQNTYNQQTNQNEAYIISANGSIRKDPKGFTDESNDNSTNDPFASMSQNATHHNNFPTSTDYHNINKPYNNITSQSDPFASSVPNDPFALTSTNTNATYDKELAELKKQQEMALLTQYEVSLPNKNKALRSQQEYVVTKMTIQQPYEILQNQSTIVLDRKRHKYTNQNHHSSGQSSLSTPDLPEDTTPQFHHKTWHQSLKRHTLNTARHSDSNIVLSGGKKQSIILSTPALDSQGNAIRPKSMSNDDFAHILATSGSNPSVLVSDYVKPTTSRDRFAQQAQFKLLKQGRVGGKIQSIDQELDQQMLSLATSIDHFEGRAGVVDDVVLAPKKGDKYKQNQKSTKKFQQNNHHVPDGTQQVLRRGESIEYLKKKEFKENQKKYMTEVPTKFELDPYALVVSDPVEHEQLDMHLAGVESGLREEKHRFRIKNQHLVDTHKIKKIQRLNLQTTRDNFKKEKEERHAVYTAKEKERAEKNLDKKRQGGKVTSQPQQNQ